MHGSSRVRSWVWSRSPLRSASQDVSGSTIDFVPDPRVMLFSTLSPASDQARARGEALQAQLDASFQSIAKNLMRTQTLDPSTYYGGMVYANRDGND
jgi:hypothetical protein